MSGGADPNWDGDLFRLYSKRMGPGSWQDDFLDGSSAEEADFGSSAPFERTGDQEYGLFGGPGADLFGSGYGSEQAEADARSGPEQYPEGGPASMPSISQPMSPLSGSMPSISGSMPSIPDQGAVEDAGSETGSLMRPYARTRGRTRAEYDLAIETLVSTSERGRTQAAQSKPEHRSICGLCTDARSVAEISAHLRLPLGVVRVLVGDMAGLGLVQIHDSGMVVGDRPSMEFLERVLSGLRKL
ncbi:uncharacterized protein DUF742 [Halopolyspora algeriensis]|uniref:Uncharacterized protein DUF742 n=1 Tax=Halopolyspora algeriensis TaxID=1500506 RepID=A0A368VPD7_9ACTN|nr:DUF742 domain-containing protein [Halopolyspora algeriensis]RCW43589.1 uncharacterized protein DUF742 [Halopolyspora algeriensis]TQM47626.1 uncharacterized protein DUF742 [Halopolyspora algeriensis]